MKKAYFFGDSFIYGWLCHPGDSYYENCNESDKRIMPKIVADDLDAELVNKAQYGFSNDAILYSVINEMHKVNEGDIVCIFDTHSTRNIFMGSNRKDIYEQWPEELRFPLDPDEADKIRGPWLEYEDQFKQLFTNLYEGIVKELRRRNVNAYYFSSGNNWYSAQGLKEDKIKNDGHWNFPGHQKAAKWVLGLIKNGYNKLI